MQPGDAGIVDEDSEPFANPDCSRSKFRMMNADLGEAMIHGPLFLGRRLLHLLLDLVEQCIEVEALSVLDDSFSCQAPACATDQVVAILPAQTEFLGVPTGASPRSR